jgi:NAD(P)-dependent dehydrogenase (short-subunit alcohol dehydrogenase family)
MQGYHVVAACLKNDSLIMLQEQNETGSNSSCSGFITPVQCDVTKSEDIDKLKAAVETLVDTIPQGRLWCLVNNAGIAHSGGMDWISPESNYQVMEVNYFAVVKVIQAFLPLLKQVRHSRIINISSIAGIFWVLPVGHLHRLQACSGGHGESVEARVTTLEYPYMPYLPGVYEVSIWSFLYNTSTYTSHSILHTYVSFWCVHQNALHSILLRGKYC